MHPFKIFKSRLKSCVTQTEANVFLASQSSLEIYYKTCHIAELVISHVCVVNTFTRPPRQIS